MDDHRNRPSIPVRGPARGVAQLLLTASLVAIAGLTLTPEGAGWAWGSPVAELRWYATGVDSATTMRQLVGNLVLLVVPAGLVVRLWPEAGRPEHLTRLALAAGTGIEVLQWCLPLGRVVSPLDAALNAVGALAAGLLVRHLESAHGRIDHPRPPSPRALTAAGQSGHTPVSHN